MEEEKDDQQNDSSKGQVDVEAPSPGYVGGEGTTNKRTNNRRDAVDCTEQTLILGSLCQRYRIDNEDHLHTLVSKLGKQPRKGGTAECTIPSWTPAAPKPAIARPIIKAIELGAAPQIADPTSNRATEKRKTALMLRKVYIFPKMSRKAQLVNMYAAPYQPTSSEAWKALVMAGVAVEMINLSYENQS